MEEDLRYLIYLAAAQIYAPAGSGMLHLGTCKSKDNARREAIEEARRLWRDLAKLPDSDL